MLVFNQEAAPFLLFKWNTCLKHLGPETECPQALLLSHTFLHGRNPPLRCNPGYLHFLRSSGKELFSPLIFKLWKECNKFSFLCLRSFLAYWFSIYSLPYLTSPPVVCTSKVPFIATMNIFIFNAVVHLCFAMNFIVYHVDLSPLSW